MTRSKNQIIGAMETVPRDMEVVIRLADGSKTSVKFGTVTIAATQFNNHIVMRNVEEGQLALARAAKKLARPGVSIRAAKDVPLYSVDEKHPNRLVRKLNGKKERGVLENGHFKAVHE